MNRRLALSLFLALAAVPAASRVAQAQDFVVVIHASNPQTSMQASEVSALFLKRVTRWPDGDRVEPIDLSARSSVRESFSEAVHGKDVAWVESYWNKMIFSGRASPPPEVDNDREVVAFVAATPDAIGYVSHNAALEGDVKTVAITE